MEYIIDNDEEYSLYTLYFVETTDPDLETFFRLAKKAYPHDSGYNFPYIVATAEQIEWRYVKASMSFTDLLDRADDWFRYRGNPVDLEAAVSMLEIVKKHRPDKYDAIAAIYQAETA